MGGPGGGLTASVTLPGHLVTVSGDTAEPGPAPRQAAFAAQAAPNGVPPQRAGLPNRPVHRATLAAPSEGQQLDRAIGVNGLPTRTPGSSLQRSPASEQPLAADSRDVADPPATEQPRTRVPGARPGAPSETGPGRKPAEVGDQAPRGGRCPGERRRTGRRLRADRSRPDHRGGTRTRRDDARGEARDGTDAGARSGADEPGGSSADNGTAAPVGGSAAGHLADLQRARAAAFARRTAATPASGVPTDVPREDDAADSRAVVPAGPSEPGGPPVGARSGGPEPEAHEAEAHEPEAHGPEAHEPEAHEPEEHERSQGEPATAAGRPTGGRGPAEAPEVAAQADDEAPDDALDATDDSTDDSTDGPVAAGAAEPTPGRDVRPRPSPRPVLPTGPNGTHRDLTAPGGPYERQLDPGRTQRRDERCRGAAGGGRPAPDGPRPGLRPGPGPGRSRDSRPDQHHSAARRRAVRDLGGRLRPGRRSRRRTLRRLPGPGRRRPLRRSGTGDLGVGRAGTAPAPVGRGRRGPVDITETTPIFAEIASAWFASDRPVPVDWELGERPDDDLAPASAPAPAAPAAPPAGSIRAGLLDGPDLPVPVPATDPNGQAFATVADEGWRAASGAAAERPDELTAAGLPSDARAPASFRAVQDLRCWPHRRRRPAAPKASAVGSPATSKVYGRAGRSGSVAIRAHRFPAGDTRGRHRRHGERRARRGNPMTGPTGPVHIAPAGISPARCSKEGA